uniref:Uncharacterized protein n=1 Tax=Oncorhynchus kisutch TaxID=8019 RepID=A0A8C7FEV0_ONCKI
MSSETKLTMLVMKLSLTITCLIFFQSLVSSPSSKQIDSKASLTVGGGLVMLTAGGGMDGGREKEGGGGVIRYLNSIEERGHFGSLKTC